MANHNQINNKGILAIYSGQYSQLVSLIKKVEFLIEGQKPVGVVSVGFAMAMLLFSNQPLFFFH